MAIWDIKERYKLDRGNIGSRSSRIVFENSAASTRIRKLDILSGGTVADFGDQTVDRGAGAGMSSNTRGCMANGAGPDSNVMDYITIATEGNAADFGDSTITVRDPNHGILGNNTRGIRMGGANPGKSNVIDYITFVHTGNATDFGDCTTTRRSSGACSSNTRGVSGGGDPAYTVIDYITLATTGNATDFGDLTIQRDNPNSNSSATRGLFGALNSPAVTTSVDTIEIASTGNATEFGDVTVARGDSGNGSNKIRAMNVGGYISSASNVIDYFTIATQGTAIDYGDLSAATTCRSYGEPVHGGIDEDALQRPSVTYMPGSGKTLICGGQLSPGSGTVDIDTYNIPTLGNARNFGDLRSQISNGIGCASSYTRAVFSSGYYFPGAPYYTAEMQAIEFATEGNVCDFGDTTQERYGHAYGNVGNTTRGLFVGGYAPGSPYIVNIIDYITIATMGNATDFGNLTNVKQAPAGASSNTRGLSLGGTTPSNINIIDYVTIASTGDASDFGDLTLSRSNCSGAASSVRAVAAGGGSPSNSDVIDYVTIASTGDASDFGNLTQAGKAACPGSNGTRAVFAGRHTPGKETTMDYITIASTGDAADFGDLKAAASEKGSASDSHGGLQS